jgi:hypothetical protein
MKEKLANFGTKAIDVLGRVFDNEIIVTLVGATVAVGCVGYAYNRGVKDTCGTVEALLELTDKVESE